MKKASVLLLFLLVMLACHDQTGPGPFMDTGNLLGFDSRLFPCLVSNPCPCPGGLFIEIKGTTYRFLEMPKNSNVILDGSTKFPIKVKLNWGKSKSCPLDLIDVNQIALL